MARHSRNVRIYKRGNTYYGDFHFITRTGQKKEFRESLKTSDKRIAEDRADQVIEQIRKALSEVFI